MGLEEFISSTGERVSIYRNPGREKGTALYLALFEFGGAKRENGGRASKCSVKIYAFQKTLVLSLDFLILNKSEVTTEIRDPR